MVVAVLVFIALCVVIYIVQSLVEGVLDWILSALFTVIAWPFVAVWVAVRGRRAKLERRPKNMLTPLPTRDVENLMRALFRAGELSPVSKVTVLSDRPGAFRIGVGYGPNVTLQFEDGTSGPPPDVPGFVFDFVYRPFHHGTHGACVWVQLPPEPDQFEESHLELIPQWVIDSLVERDPQLELVGHQDAQARGLVDGTGRLILEPVPPPSAVAPRPLPGPLPPVVAPRFQPGPPPPPPPRPTADQRMSLTKPVTGGRPGQSGSVPS